jgi:hypothetical protein
MLSYGVVVGVSDEYCKLGEVTTMGALKEFYKAVNLLKEKRVEYFLLCLSCAANPLEFF